MELNTPFIASAGVLGLSSQILDLQKDGTRHPLQVRVIEFSRKFANSINVTAENLVTGAQVNLSLGLNDTLWIQEA